MNDADRAAADLKEAARLNREDPLLEGSLLVFPNYGQVVMTGDLHGHRRNFEKLQRFCNLEQFGARHVVLHEIIHQEPESSYAGDCSHQILLEAARWKCAFPEQVHFLLSNHELAQLRRRDITKNGRVVTAEFEDGVRRVFGRDVGGVMEAIERFIASLPLAGRTPNRVFLSHSLPNPREIETFDPKVLARRLTDEDLSERGAAHSLVWGRYHGEADLEALRKMLDVDYFICGHQPQEMGYDVVHQRMIILASEHNHGVFLPFDLSKPQSLDALTGNIRMFAGVM